MSAQGLAPTIFVSLAEARAVLETFAAVLPAELKSKDATSLPAFWPEWVRRSDAQTRARLERGDEDSLVNLLLFGTSFTRQPRLTARQIDDVMGGSADPVAAGSKLDAITRSRLDDFVAAAQAGGNERLDDARHVLAASGVTLDTEAGRSLAKAHLLGELARVLKEIGTNARAIELSRQTGIPGMEFAERSQLYRARGLSSDTSLLPNFAIEQALKAMRAKGTIARNIRRVAVIGPGLDFTDKQEGYDFYPQQTLQPFAILDSVLRLGLADPRGLQVTTLDVSPRINAHLAHLQARSRRGDPYVLQLPLDAGEPWTDDFLQYWTHFGDEIGAPARPAAVPPNTGDLRLRAVAVRPGFGATLAPADVNIVLQRLDLPVDERFDVIVGTNIFVYYDEFQKALAMANIEHMLRPGGVLLSNNALVELPSSRLHWIGDTTVAYSHGKDNGDTVVWYRKSEEQ